MSVLFFFVVAALVMFALMALFSRAQVQTEALPTRVTHFRCWQAQQVRDMSNSQFVAVVGAVIMFLIGTLLFERYADCQSKGGSLVMRPRPLHCQTGSRP